MSQLIADWVIDAYTHITEPPDTFSSRVPAKYRDLAPKIVNNRETGADEWVVGDRSPITSVGHSAVAGWKEPRALSVLRIRAWFKKGTVPFLNHARFRGSVGGMRTLRGRLTVV